MTNTPMTPDREQEIREAARTFSEHPVLGFACCSAHDAADAVPELLAEVDRLRARIAELEGAAKCPSRITTPLGTPRTSECALPVRHRGDHRNAAKDHYWDDEYADAARAPQEASTSAERILGHADDGEWHDVTDQSAPTLSPSEFMAGLLRTLNSPTEGTP